MRGRTQAIAVSVLSVGTVFFAWVGAAAVALVTLRKGSSEGGWLLAWTMVPAAFIALQGSDLGPITTLIGVYIAACVLRLGSWPLALLVISASGLILALLMNTVAQAQSQQIADMLAMLSEQLRAGNPDVQMPVLSATDVAGMVGAINAWTVVLGLALARWWQAMLYNPGGFRSEFHALRLPQALAVGLVLGMLLLASSGAWANWAMILQMPLSVAGFGLVHALVARSRLGVGSLVMFYMLWALLLPLRWVVQLLAVTDSFIDVRKRLPVRQSGE
ncbi:hypothetical protein [Litorivivens sp.]|uniref:hypothetical protein n=1 Tax=Litorivivens sp. TaxID=2020868 RepID=UPI0035628CDC